MNVQADFDDEQWVSSLAESLAELSHAQSSYVDAYFQSPLHESATGPERDAAEPFHGFSEALGRLYHEAYIRDRPPSQRQYGPVRPALEQVLNVFKQHPVFENVLARRRDNDVECWIRVLGSGGLTHLVYVAAGLMGRAQTVPDGGFTAASVELAALLWLSRLRDVAALPNHYNRGYHIVPFFGLHVSENVRISRDITLVPFKEIKPFINVDDLRQLAPDIVSFRPPEILGAIRKPFLWKPVLQSHGSLDCLLSPPPSQFFRDADASLKLLSITHATPIVRLADMSYCIQQRAARVLGHHRYQGGITWTPSRPTIDTFAQPQPLRSDALAEAKKAFKKRNGQQFRTCAPIIARLAESWARTGPFAMQDRILDVAISLERMYELDPGEISFKLRARAACFLADNTDARKRIFRQIREFYNLRSALVHSRKPSKASRKLLTPENMKQTFDTGSALARDTLMKLLASGAPNNWDELVISAGESRENDPGKPETS